MYVCMCVWMYICMFVCVFETCARDALKQNRTCYSYVGFILYDPHKNIYSFKAPWMNWVWARQKLVVFIMSCYDVDWIRTYICTYIRTFIHTYKHTYIQHGSFSFVGVVQFCGPFLIGQCPEPLVCRITIKCTSWCVYHRWNSVDESA